MALIHKFTKAGFASLSRLANLPLDRTKDYLVVTGLDLFNPIHAAMADGSTVFFQPLSSETNEANDTLNAVSKWMRDAGVLDQRAYRGDDRREYNIGLYFVPDGDISRASLRNDFYLADYVFADRKADQAVDFDDLMRMLDRDRLSGAMIASLKNDFEMTVRAEAPHDWMRDIRFCSHPDHKPRIQSANIGAMSAFA